MSTAAPETDLSLTAATAAAVGATAVGTPSVQSVIATYRLSLGQLVAEMTALIATIWSWRRDDNSVIGSTLDWADLMVSLIGQYRDGASRISLVALQQLKLAQVGEEVAADMLRTAQPADEKWLRRSLGFAGPGTVRAYTERQLLGTWTGDPSAKALKLVTGTAARWVLDAAREAMLETGLAEARSRAPRSAQAWARVTDADPCAFCAMLAARGAVYLTQSSASWADGIPGNPYHDHCACTAVLLWRDEPLPQAEAFAALWAEVTRGLSGQDARNAFRRSFEAAKRAAGLLAGQQPTTPGG